MAKRSACEVNDADYENISLTHKIQTITNLYECINNCGLMIDLINQRDENSEKYNLFIKYTDAKGKEKKDSILLIDKEELLEQYIDPFISGSNIMFDGTQIKYESVNTIKVSKGKFTKIEIPFLFKKWDDHFYSNEPTSRIKYFENCENITREFIKTTKTLTNKDRPDYIFPERLKELKGISNPTFDLTKLLQLCKELNLAHKNGMLYTTAALVRAICDHVPPIFDLPNFEQVASNYKADKNTKSFKEGVKRLHDFFKHAADGVMHSQIRKKESLPTPEQLDVSKELDFLLQEVCRVLK
jgi:hypothetical protein